MGVANREIGGLALEKCRNPSEKIDYRPDKRLGERGTKCMATLARSSPLVIHLKASSTGCRESRDSTIVSSCVSHYVS